MKSYRAIEQEVLRWAEARKIYPRSTPLAQAVKTLEEAGELMEAATALKVIDDILQILPDPTLARDQVIEYRNIWLDKYKDAAGDVTITLVNGCALADVDLVECFAGAYEEIKERSGTLGEDGIFRKDK
jgi:NTP pyrophosphatase (non-canonical NTP hydrolase)